jgi:hypothetical protein
MMLTIEKKDNGTVEVWQFDYESKHSVRVCTQPDKLASTLPRDVLVMVRKLVNELDRLLPKESVLMWTSVPGRTVTKGSTSLAYNNESSPAADDCLERV